MTDNSSSRPIRANPVAGQIKHHAVALVTAGSDHFNTLLTWFKHADDMFRWGGPGITFPSHHVQFLRDTGWQKIASVALVYESELFLPANEQQMLGFAQVYKRLARYHFGRVAIAPRQRGQQLGQQLLQQLCEAIKRGGVADSTRLTQSVLAMHPQGGINVQSQTLALPFSANGFSLFVLSGNKPAIRCYEKLGFAEQRYPDAIPGGLQNCLYMVKE